MNNKLQTIDVKQISTPEPQYVEEIKYWDAEYVNAKIEQIKKKRDKIFFMFLWFTGVRVSEALAVEKQHVDFKNYIITIQWLKNRKRQTRKVPMHPTLRNVLDFYVDGLKYNEKLFAFTRQNADLMAKKYFEGGHCHKLRHSFAINWLRNGGDLYLLSRMLGHKSITVTEEYLCVVPVDVGRELLKIKFDGERE